MRLLHLPLLLLFTFSTLPPLSFANGPVALAISPAFFDTTTTTATGNTHNPSFSKAKRLLQAEVYKDHPKTLYCEAGFDSSKRVIAPPGFATSKHTKRAQRIEWEHVVPAENFGRNLSEWRNGHPQCVNSKGKPFKGRKCAEKMVEEYRYMQADMYNLFPAIGAVNALRSNYTFTLLPNTPASFGSCPMKIDQRKAEPPESARGRIARTYLYMDATYTHFAMSRKTRQLMEAWDRMYPVNQWECARADRIRAIQGNRNPVMEQACGHWVANN
ncbi:endonuclease I [Aestuariicella hydrocarbonica]|uniref:Endonuclease I n=1 Tax=Pseudomaricurvus hydrocarbonicus TaxID=1470433 RepID=A0A9E5JYM0_9GAMM|nr:endonuclease [Aestuariicella hydrocarbonica]NHO64547.1 endonuclease I [Aestuariicella hydrocarbonica]